MAQYKLLGTCMRLLALPLACTPSRPASSCSEKLRLRVLKLWRTLETYASRDEKTNHTSPSAWNVLHSSADAIARSWNMTPNSRIPGGFSSRGTERGGTGMELARYYRRIPWISGNPTKMFPLSTNFHMTRNKTFIGTQEKGAPNSPNETALERKLVDESWLLSQLGELMWALPDCLCIGI